jgi:FAD-dependent urate hydroxylase
MSVPFVESVIVGAGPYGLSIAAHLRAAGFPFRIYGTPLESWQTHMPEGMLLRSEPFASSLWDPKGRFTVQQFFSEKRIPYQPTCKPICMELFLRYGEWFREGAVGEVHDVKVRRIRRNSSTFMLELADGELLETRRVILATGQMAFRHVPPEISKLPEALCKHSSLMGDVNAFFGRECTVIGAGQSALESAALLHEAGAKVRVLARRDRIIWHGEPKFPRPFVDRIHRPDAGLCAGWGCLAVSELPRAFRWLFPAHKRHRYVASSFGPAGAWWLRERVEGRIDLLLRHRIQSADLAGGRVRLSVEGPQGLKEIASDCLIAATGFKVNIDRLDFLDPSLLREIARENHSPVLDASFET